MTPQQQAEEPRVSQQTIGAERQALTDARSALAHAEAERQQLAGIIDGSRDAIWSWATDGVITRWNAEAERLFGYTAAEIIGQTIFVLIPKERIEAAKKVLSNLENGAWYGQYETVRLRKDRTPVQVELTVSPLKDESGKVIGASTVCRDISERKYQEHSLATRMRELAALYQLTDRLQRANSIPQICDAALDAIFSALGCERASILLFDAENVIRFVAWRGLSDAYRAAVDGHSPWTADTTNPEPIWIEDIVRTNESENLKATIRAENIRALAFIPLLTNGRLLGKFMTYYDKPHRFSGEETRLAVNIARQVGFSLGRQRAEQERRATDRSLRDSEHRLEMALSAGRMGAWEWNIATGEVIWSPGLAAIHGLEPGQFSGRFEDFTRDMHPEDIAGVLAAVKQALETKSAYHVAYRMAEPFGRRWLEAFGRVILGDDGTPQRLAGICMDITERKLAEERQELLINELNHRVKNTLATVQSIAGQTLRGRGVDRTVQEALEARLIALSNAHSLLTQQNWEGADIGEIVSQALEAHAAPGRVSLQGPAVRLPPKAAVAIAMGLHELATNASKYGALSNDTGLVLVNWSLSAERSPRLRLEWREQGGPPVTRPARRGFGSRLIERNLAYDLDGQATIDFHPDGVICIITGSAANLAENASRTA